MKKMTVYTELARCFCEPYMPVGRYRR